MKQLVVISGKGGTGKTSILASLAQLAASTRPVVTADCDVEAPDLALLLAGQDIRTEEFWSGRRARIDAGSCTLCEVCVDHCRPGAAVKGWDSIGASLASDKPHCDRAPQQQHTTGRLRHGGAREQIEIQPAQASVSERSIHD